MSYSAHVEGFGKYGLCHADWCTLSDTLLDVCIYGGGRVHYVGSTIYTHTHTHTYIYIYANRYICIYIHTHMYRHTVV